MFQVLIYTILILKTKLKLFPAVEDYLIIKSSNYKCLPSQITPSLGHDLNVLISIELQFFYIKSVKSIFRRMGNFISYFRH